MANVFGILTAIVLALSAFVAFKNKARYETQIGATQTAKASLVKSQARLATDKEVLAQLPITISGVDTEVEKLTSDEAAQTKTNETVKADVDAKTKKIATNKEKLDGIREQTEKTGNLDELAAKMRSANAELLELGESIGSNEAKIANLTAENTATQARIDAAKAVSDNYANSQSLPALNTRIRSIYPNWGFVTLAAGNSSGVVNNSTLNVVRGGETIASLLVTAVESSTASATIVPDSLGADVTLMVGDKVVPGVKAPKPAAK